MNERKKRRDTEKVVRKVLKFVEQFDTIGREEFSAVNRKVMEHVSRNTGISKEQVLQKMSTVIQDLPHEYGQIDENLKSWDALIAYLYVKYLKELGVN
jgi:mevalonate kinase